MAASVAGAGVRLDVFGQVQVDVLPQLHDLDYVRVRRRNEYFERGDHV